ncbi:MAG: 16S rRNA (guanine(966)-N(2))-methyltransferase RsmD [Actinomycetia bacterium]|nr:16S rRNA (guanine(966)-N(2))-methyltransferase RsmD [Actinomycetes bacterium]
MRIVSGIHRRRQLASPDHDGIRPTSDRVRESVFNSLGSLGLVDDIRVLDLFAGTGALGLEALSRGADHVTFVERDRDALESLRENIEILEEGDRSTVIAGNAETFVATTTDWFEVGLVDPPYAYAGWVDLLERVPADVLVIESDREIDVPAAWESLRVKHYAGTVVGIVRRAAPAA